MDTPPFTKLWTGEMGRLNLLSRPWIALEATFTSWDRGSH